MKKDLLKEIVSMEHTKILIDLGFTDKDYTPLAGYYSDSEYPSKLITTHCIPAPTYSQCFRWFREKHESYHDIYLQGTEQKFTFLIIQGERRFVKGEERDFESYEAAELSCLKKLIEIVKEKL